MHGVGALGIGNLEKSHGQGYGHGRLTRGYWVCGGRIWGGANLWPGLQQAGL